MKYFLILFLASQISAAEVRVLSYKSEKISSKTIKPKIYKKIPIGLEVPCYELEIDCDTVLDIPNYPDNSVRYTTVCITNNCAEKVNIYFSRGDIGENNQIEPKNAAILVIATYKSKIYGSLSSKIKETQFEFAEKIEVGMKFDLEEK